MRSRPIASLDLISSTQEASQLKYAPRYLSVLVLDSHLQQLLSLVSSHCNTTCAVIDITHTIGKLLEDHRYVRCIMLDFTKAFDTVDHLMLLQKLEQYHLPNNILSWIVSFLSERRQTTKISGISSGVVQINRSILQGSVIDPRSFLIYMDDLKPRGISNVIIKFADDTTLLVPEN